MAEKVLRLHPSRVFFLDAGLHLANPEKPVVILPESYEAPDKVLIAIKSGTLIDVNNNIAVKEEVKEEAPVEVIEPAEVAPADEAEGEVEAKEEKKKAASKKKK